MYQLWISKGWDVKWEGHFPKSESINKVSFKMEILKKKKKEKGIINSQF